MWWDWLEGTQIQDSWKKSSVGTVGREDTWTLPPASLGTGVQDTCEGVDSLSPGLKKLGSSGDTFSSSFHLQQFGLCLCPLAFEFTKHELHYFCGSTCNFGKWLCMI